jgi:hypothetical protein
MTVIARLDRAIQRKVLDSPVEPENDKKTKLCRHTNDRISNSRNSRRKDLYPVSCRL